MPPLWQSISPAAPMAAFLFLLFCFQMRPWGIHASKLAAFAGRYQGGAALDALSQAWNRGEACGPEWKTLQSQLPAQQNHAKNWCARLANHADLASQLAEFHKSLLK